MQSEIHGTVLVNTFSLVWFKPGRSFVNKNLWRTVSMLSEASLSKMLMFRITQFTGLKNLKV